MWYQGQLFIQGAVVSLWCDLAAMSFLDPPFSDAQPGKMFQFKPREDKAVAGDSGPPTTY